VTTEQEDVYGVAHHETPILNRCDKTICLAMAEWWSELINEPERPHWGYDMDEFRGDPFCVQCRYEVLKRDEAGKPTRLKFGPYEFRCWRGESPYGSKHDGWWLQYEPAKKEEV
jgi:hypothetical protein